MKPDHKAALAKCRAWPHKSNTAACYLDAMTSLDKATELLRRAISADPDFAPTITAIRAFLERESSG